MVPTIRIPSLLALLALLASGQLCAQTSDTLFQLFPSRVHTLVKSSYDPNDREGAPWRGNDDGFSGNNLCEAFRLDDNGTPVSVLADMEGRSGVLGLFYRNFWSGAYGLPALAGENNRTRIWIDDNSWTNPAFDMPLWDYFRSQDGALEQIPPFDGPFTIGRSGAHLTHAQLVWDDSFRIGLDDDPFRNAARFHRVAMTLASPEGELPMPDMAAWEAVAEAPGEWPHSEPRNLTPVQLPVAGNGGRNHVMLTGPGTLLEVTFEVPSHDNWKDLWARFTWDNAAQPNVEMPLRHLGAMIEPPFSHPIHSLLVDNDGDKRVTCWFPMPFKESAKLEIENRGAAALAVRLSYALSPGIVDIDDKPWGYFTSVFRREITGTGEPFQGPRLTDCKGMLRFLMLEDFADTSGRIPDMDMAHLEGDVCVRINGNRGDDHTFSASETGIGRWGWYITPSDRAFDSDTSFQSSLKARFLPNSYTEGRRIMGSHFIFDPVHFVDGIDIVLEHGRQNTSNADYSLVAFFYVQQGSARRTIAEIDIGNTSPTDPLAEPQHQVQFTASSTYTQQGNFLRDQFYGTPPVTETVRQIRDFMRFEVRRPADAADRAMAVGFRLDRLGGPAMGRCQADVFVNGQPAGLLHVFTHNAVFPWKEGGECEVELPVALTDGLSTFTVELRPRASSDALNVARVWVYEYVK